MPQFLIDTLNRKPHHIKITSLQPCTTYVTDPFLNAIGTSFVKRLIMIYIITDLIIRKRFERYFCCNRKGTLLMLGSKTNTCNYMMRLSAQHLQHSSGIFSITRLPENDSLSFLVILFASCWRNHNRICCKNQSF